MNVLLLLPPHESSERYSKKMEKVVGVFPPLGLLYIAAVLESGGHKVKILDGGKHPEINVIKEIENFKPDIVGLSSMTFLWERCKTIAKEIKENFPDIFVLVGGPHPTVLPEECMKEASWIDAVGIGECEYSMLEAVNNIEKGKSLKDVKGLFYRENGKILKNSLREPPQDLDKLPFPARHLLEDIKEYIPSATEYKRLPVLSMMASRGCVFRCLFCSNITGKVIRFRTPGNVLTEIDELVEKYGTKDIYFFDDTFTTNKKWVMEICDLLIERDYDLIWSAQGRANTVDREILEKMKKAGCWKIFYGFESCLQKNLNMLRKGITLEQIKNATKLTQEIGIEVEGSFIFGIPGETYSDALKTIESVKKLNPDYVKFYPLTPLPGTDLMKNVNEYGKLLIKNFSEFTEARVVFTPHTMTKDELEFLIPKAYKEFYLRPKIILKRILKLRSVEDLKRSARAFLSLMSM